MAIYEVIIGEVGDASPGPLRPGEPTPEVRSVYWRGEAANERAARDAAYEAWDQKYGRGRQPAQALVKVTLVDSNAGASPANSG